MAEIKWIKITTDLFDDEKIKYIETLPNGDETIVIWFRLMCLAGRSNSSGFLMMTEKVYYTEEILSSIFSRDIKAIQLALNIFQNLDMIEIIDNKIYLSNWEKHQNAEAMLKIKEQTKERVFKHRNKQLALHSVTEPLHDRYSNATDKELDKELDKDKDNNNNNKDIVGKTFVKPTIKEIEDYCLERKNKINAEEFYDFYETSNWFRGKTKIKDWKGCIRIWERNNNTKINNYSKLQKNEPIPDYKVESKPLTKDEMSSLQERLKKLSK